MRYIDIDLFNHQFHFQERYTKPQAQGSALHTLQKIEQVLRERISIDHSFLEHSDLTFGEATERLFKKAKEIKDGYLRKTGRLGRVRRYFGKVDQKEYAIKQLYRRIHHLSIDISHEVAMQQRLVKDKVLLTKKIPKFHPLVVHNSVSEAITDCLTIKEIGRLFCVFKGVDSANRPRERNLIALHAMIRRAQKYGCRSGLTFEAREYLQTIFGAIPTLFRRYPLTTYSIIQNDQLNYDRTMENFIQKRDAEQTKEEVKGALISTLSLIISNTQRGNFFLWIPYKEEARRLIKTVVYLGVNTNQMLPTQNRLPLYAMAMSGDAELTELFLQYGANPNLRESTTHMGNYYKQTILRHVVTHYHENKPRQLAVAQALLEHANKENRADPNLFFTDADEVPTVDLASRLRPIFWAARMGNVDMVRLLLDNGAYYDTTDIDPIRGVDRWAGESIRTTIASRRKRREIALELLSRDPKAHLKIQRRFAELDIIR